MVDIMSRGSWFWRQSRTGKHRRANARRRRVASGKQEEVSTEGARGVLDAN